MLNNITALGKFCIHIGGIGDVFYALSSCYDEEEQITFLSYANDPKIITELLGSFKKINRKLVLPNIADYLAMAQTMTHAEYTGHLPPALNYMKWADYHIFNDFNLTQVSWTDEVSQVKVRDLQVCIQPSGSGKGGHPSKHVCIEPKYWQSILNMLREHNISPCILGTPDDIKNYSVSKEENYTHLSLWEQMELIKGSDLMIGADTWGKNFSLFAKIPTIVWKNNYVGEMANFDNDPADPIFVHQWEQQGNLMVIEQEKIDTLTRFDKCLKKIFK
jgi:hypothetical protein|tara:strand:- start:5946 stop:6770 length:825 start_codon:yes stop_codon:yes gene_type:complete